MSSYNVLPVDSSAHDKSRDPQAANLDQSTSEDAPLVCESPDDNHHKRPSNERTHSHIPVATERGSAAEHDTPAARRFLSSRAEALVHYLVGKQYRVKLVERMASKSLRILMLLFEKLFFELKLRGEDMPLPETTYIPPRSNPFTMLEKADTMDEKEISQKMVRPLKPTIAPC